MPTSYRVRSKRGHARTTLTEEEEVELCIGQAADRRSLFADALDYALARDLLDADLATRDPLTHLINARAILVELARRHDPHWGYGPDDPDYVECVECNPRQYQPLELRGVSLTPPLDGLDDFDDEAEEPQP